MSNDPKDPEDVFGTLALTDDGIQKELPIGLYSPDPVPPDELQVVEACYRNGPKGSGCVAFVTSEDADGNDTGELRWDNVVPNFGMPIPETEGALWAKRMSWPEGMEPSLAQVQEFQIWADAEVAAETYWALKEHRAARAAAAGSEAPPVRPAKPGLVSDPDDPEPPPRGRQPRAGGFRVA